MYTRKIIFWREEISKYRKRVPRGQKERFSKFKMAPGIHPIYNCTKFQLD